MTVGSGDASDDLPARPDWPTTTLEGSNAGSGLTQTAVDDSHAWRQFEHLSGLYTYYLDLVVKGTGGYFLVVGGVLTLVLANVRNEPILVVALSVPILMSVLLAIAAWKATDKARELHHAISVVAAASRTQLQPHVEILVWLVRWSAPLLLIAAGLLAGLLGWLVATD
jgi:hypothetical protein